MAKQKIPYTFKDEHELYTAYMPYLKNGGLFIKTDQDFNFGDVVELEITFFEEEQPKTITGKIIWHAATGVQNKFPVGIGVQFQGQKAQEINDLILKHLEKFTDLEAVTDTM
ncbi:MAG: PilZ domain-containing protein [Candidatus Neomarinimicrobiota bacterium]